jgi:putative membrane protein
MPEQQDLEIPGGSTWAEGPGLVARGFCMGLADVVPGVSGGTMALILGIYARLVAAIRSFDRGLLERLWARDLAGAHRRTAWRFLGCVVLGQALGIVMATAVVRLPILLEEHPQPVYGLFFGLIVGSVMLLGRDVHRQGLSGARVGSAVAGLLVGLLVVTAVPSDTPHERWFVFLCGCVAISAMILPGISGSFVLLLLKQYTYVLGALGEVIHPQSGLLADRWVALHSVVVPFGLGCVVGILAFTRLLHWLLARAQWATMSFMTGLLVGSLYAVWPFAARHYELVRGKQRLVSSAPRWPAAFDGDVALALGLILVGVAAVLIMDRVARKDPVD